MTNEETPTEETPESVELEDWNNSFQKDETTGIEDLPKKPFTRTRCHRNFLIRTYHLHDALLL